MSKSDGLFIVIEFSKPLVGDISGNELFFTVTAPMYDYVPGGTISNVIVPVISTARYLDTQNSILLEFGQGNSSSFQNTAGPITIEYSGGTLQGTGGPVEAFVDQFTATDLSYKGHQNDEEHLDISSVSALGTIVGIVYRDIDNTEEHIGIPSVMAVAALTHIDDV